MPVVACVGDPGPGAASVNEPPSGENVSRRLGAAIAGVPECASVRGGTADVASRVASARSGMEEGEAGLDGSNRMTRRSGGGLLAAEPASRAGAEAEPSDGRGVDTAARGAAGGSGFASPPGDAGRITRTVRGPEAPGRAGIEGVPGARRPSEVGAFAPSCDAVGDAGARSWTGEAPGVSTKRARASGPGAGVDAMTGRASARVTSGDPLGRPSMPRGVPAGDSFAAPSTAGDGAESSSRRASGSGGSLTPSCRATPSSARSAGRDRKAVS